MKFEDVKGIFPDAKESDYHQISPEKATLKVTKDGFDGIGNPIGGIMATFEDKKL